jgi:predicted nucleotide-binding protein
LKAFIEKRPRLKVVEFNEISAAGITTADRLAEMLDTATLAFLIMTAEDEQADGKLHARLNVIHVAGLFQGRLGFDKAIILLEEGCEEFSNIHGLGYILFPKNNIKAKFKAIRDFVKREQIAGKSIITKVFPHFCPRTSRPTSVLPAQMLCIFAEYVHAMSGCKPYEL